VRSVFALVRPGNESCRRSKAMLTAGWNALTFACFGALLLYHTWGRDGFGFLLTGLAGIGVVIWAVARSERNEPTKN
jgi:hypothetical protein